MTEKSIVNHVFVLQRNGNVNKDKGQPVQPFQPERVPVQVPRRDAWVPSRTLYCTPLMDLSQIDGKVIFRVIIMLKMLLAISVQGKILSAKYISIVIITGVQETCF